MLFQTVSTLLHILAHKTRGAEVDLFNIRSFDRGRKDINTRWSRSCDGRRGDKNDRSLLYVFGKRERRRTHKALAVTYSHRHRSGHRAESYRVGDECVYACDDYVGREDGKYFSRCLRYVVAERFLRRIFNTLPYI